MNELYFCSPVPFTNFFLPQSCVLLQKVQILQGQILLLLTILLKLAPGASFSLEQGHDEGYLRRVVTRQSHHIDTVTQFCLQSDSWLQSTTVLATCVYNRLGFAGLEVILILRQLCFVPSFVAATVVINRQDSCRNYRNKTKL